MCHDSQYLSSYVYTCFVIECRCVMIFLICFMNFLIISPLHPKICPIHSKNMLGLACPGPPFFLAVAQGVPSGAPKICKRAPRSLLGPPWGGKTGLSEDTRAQNSGQGFHMIKKIAAAMTVLALTSFAGSALAEGDAAAGAKVFKKCKACHMVTTASPWRCQCGMKWIKCGNHIHSQEEQRIKRSKTSSGG